MNTISNWIQETNIEISNRNQSSKEFDRFIQLYFLLENLLEQITTNVLPVQNRTNTQLVTECLPKIVNNKWGTISNPVKDSLNDEGFLIHLSMQYHLNTMLEEDYFTSTGISASRNKVIVELKKDLGYFDKSTSFQHDSLTKSDFEHYSKILKFKNFSQNYSSSDKNNFKNLLEGTLKIIYAVRNNFYHGGKQKLDSQDKLIRYINLSMLKIIKIIYTINNETSSNNWSFWNQLSSIESQYTTILRKAVKARLKRLYRKEKNDIEQWVQLSQNGNKHLNFSYYFIAVERLQTMIERAFFFNFRNIIEAINCLNNFFSLSVNVTNIESKYNNSKSIRNNIFHGSSSINLNQDLANSNIELVQIIDKVKDMIQDIIDL